jgi:hypothetical protein
LLPAQLRPPRCTSTGAAAATAGTAAAHVGAATAHRPHAAASTDAGTCGWVVGEGQVGGGGQVACVCGGGACVGDEFEQCDALGHTQEFKQCARIH